MKRLDWKKTIRLNILALKIVGLWPKEDESYKFNSYTLYTVLSTILFQVGHIFFQTVYVFYILDDLEAVTNIIFVLLMEMLVTFKAYCIIKNMGMLKQLMVTLNSDLFQPKNFHQRTLIQPNLDTWKRIAYSCWTLAASWLFFWISFPILDGSFLDYRLPFQAWYPYDVNCSPLYELTYLYQAISVAYICIINNTSDALIAALNMYIGTQIDILCDDLRNLNNNEQELSLEVNEKLLKYIHHHREILKFANYANQFYNGLLFGEFFIGGMSIGLGIFQLTVVPPFSSEFYSFLSYSNALILQVFLYCWFGNEIEKKSDKLLYAVFESNWIVLSPKVKNNLIILNMRLQQSLKISALGLFDLSLETFMKILRTAYSYFALLQQVNSRK